MKLQPRDRKHLLRAALGEVRCDLLVKNARLVNVLTGEIYPANVFVDSGMIAHVEYRNLEADLEKAEEVIDAGGAYLIPGFIDAHVHIESSMMTPRNFAKAVLPKGTTTVITDPHEIANVWGVEGVRYMHDASQDLPMRQLLDIPSCVPAVPGMENAGAAFLAPEILELSGLDRTAGLAEVMDFLGVAQGDQRMLDIIAAAESRGLYLQGHAPGQTGRVLSAYRCGGPSTCHESSSGEEALEKLRSGISVDARDSSILKNVKSIWSGVKDVRFFDQLCFCTDDREADEILEHGHVNDVVRSAIACGMDPVAAIKSATFNAAREAHIDNLGAVAPGFAADFLLVDDLRELRPSHVFFAGKLAAKDGKLTAEIPDRSFPLEKRNSVCVRELSEEDFTLRVSLPDGRAAVNLLEYPDPVVPVTVRGRAEAAVRGGRILLEDPDLRYVAVVNHYPGRDTIGLGVVRGFGLRSGALASTVSHDSHNLTIVYDRPENALLAARELIRCGGGMCAVENGEVLYTLELPLAGLMSLLPAEELAVCSQRMKEAERRLGLTALENPLLRIVTLALPVVPDLKMSDLGMVDVLRKELVPLLAEEDARRER